jgi:hypothetical protein
MGAAAGIMMGAQGAAGMGTAYSQSVALRSQGNYAAAVGGMNAQLEDLQAEDATSRGAAGAAVQDAKTQTTIGAQRAAYAANGVNANSGSAAQVEGATQTLGALDSMTIRNNAIRQAFGYKTQAINSQFGGELAQSGADFEANETLLTGGMNAITSIGKGLYSAYGGSNSSPGSNTYVPSTGDLNFSYTGALGTFGGAQ